MTSLSIAHIVTLQENANLTYVPNNNDCKKIEKKFTSTLLFSKLNLLQVLLHVALFQNLSKKTEWVKHYNTGEQNLLDSPAVGTGGNLFFKIYEIM